MCDDLKEIVRPGLCHRIKNEIPEIKKKLRARVPATNYRDVRRAREPWQYALLAELVEEGFEKSATFFKALVEKDDNCVLEGRDKLRDYPNVMLQISEALREAELHFRKDESKKGILALLQLSKNLAFEVNGIDGLTWATEDVFHLTLDESKLHLNHELSAIVQFFFGKFYNKVKLYDASSMQFDQVLLFSENEKWKAEKSDKYFLYKTACLEYLIVIMNYAKDLVKKNPSTCQIISQKSIKIAEKADLLLSIGDAHCNDGEILAELQKYDDALTAFKKALSSYHAIVGFKDKIASTEIKVGACFEKLGRPLESINHVNRAMEIGHSLNLFNIIADGHVLLGHANRKIGESKLASEHYLKSIELFNELGEEVKMRHARCLSAISIAQDMIVPMTKLILKSDKAKFGNNPYRDKLLKWKLNREPFWEPDTDFIIDSDDESIILKDHIEEPVRSDELIIEVDEAKDDEDVGSDLDESESGEDDLVSGSYSIYSKSSTYPETQNHIEREIRDRKMNKIRRSISLGRSSIE